MTEASRETDAAVNPISEPNVGAAECLRGTLSDEVLPVEITRHQKAPALDDGVPA